MAYVWSLLLCSYVRRCGGKRGGRSSCRVVGVGTETGRQLWLFNVNKTLDAPCYTPVRIIYTLSHASRCITYPKTLHSVQYRRYRQTCFKRRVRNNGSKEAMTIPFLRNIRWSLRWSLLGVSRPSTSGHSPGTSLNLSTFLIEAVLSVCI